MSIQDNIRTSLLSGGGYAAGPQKNTPPQYKDRQTQYLGEVTERFNAEYAKYASDYMTGTLEYFDPAGSIVQTETTFRFANVVRPTAAIQRNFDDYKAVLFDQLEMDYIQPGAKLTTNGSVWIAYNPDNISSVAPNSIFRRCNAVWNHLDFYGNVVSEPIIVEPERANASTPDAQNSQMVSRGYYNVVCQYNDFTRQINDNTRLVLGGKSYEVTGYGDFSMEFTGDYSSVRLLKFTIRVETKNQDTDDMENHVAGGKNFTWVPYFYGPDRLSVNTTENLYRVISARNGDQVDSSAEQPISYTFRVDDESVAALYPFQNEYFWIVPKTEGSVTVTATLDQNTAVQASFEITITAAGKTVRFENKAPGIAMTPMQTIPLTARALDENDVPQNLPITFTPSGAAEGSYAIAKDGLRSITVTCFGYSETPLTITATCGAPGYEGLSDSVTICLEGY